MSDTVTPIEKSKKQFMPNIAPAPFILSHGKGSRVWDTTGKSYLDFSCGIAVTNLGHSHPAVINAIRSQSEKIQHTSNMFWNSPSMELADRLTRFSFADRVFLCNSGTEANEAMLKLARKYFFDLGTPRPEYLSFKKSFHGRTMGSLSATGQDKYWKGFEPLIPGFQFADYNDIGAVEKITEKTAAVIVEPIQGEGGVYPAKKEFLEALRKRCNETGTLLAMDEIQTGMGRTGRLFATDFYGIKPDMMSLAKGLGGGLPIGALLATEKVAASMTVGSHATTFGGNPVCAAAAVAVMDVMTSPDFFATVEKNATYCWNQLQTHIRNHPSVTDIRGRGFMLGIEFKSDINPLFEKLRSRGLLVTRIPPTVLRILPPLICTIEEIDEFISGLKVAISE